VIRPSEERLPDAPAPFRLVPEDESGVIPGVDPSRVAFVVLAVAVAPVDGDRGVPSHG
jgi:hypothetical protein